MGSGSHLDDVVMTQVLEQAHLPDGGGRDALIVVVELDLLECDQLAVGGVARLVHIAVGALPDLIQLHKRLASYRSSGAFRHALTGGSQRRRRRGRAAMQRRI